MTSHHTSNAEHVPTQRRLLQPCSEQLRRLLEALDREHGQVFQDDSAFTSYLTDTDSFPGSIARSDERWKFLSLATGIPVHRRDILDAAKTENPEFFSHLRWQMQQAIRDYPPTSKLYSVLTRGFPPDEPQMKRTVHFSPQDQPPTSIKSGNTDRSAKRWRNAIDFLARLKAKTGRKTRKEDGSDDAGPPMEQETPEESARALLALNKPLSDNRVPADRSTIQKVATGSRARPAPRSCESDRARPPIPASSALTSIVEGDEQSGSTLSRAIRDSNQQTSEGITGIAIGAGIIPATQSTTATERAFGTLEKRAKPSSVDRRSEASSEGTSTTTWIKRSAATLLGLGVVGAGLYTLYDPAGSRERALAFMRSSKESAMAAGH